jgi:putative transposase
MSERDVISDRLWAQMEPLLPSTAPQRGGRWRHSHRELLEAIAWRFRTGAPWRDLPERFGPWQTAYHRHNCWFEDGTYCCRTRQMAMTATRSLRTALTGLGLGEGRLVVSVSPSSSGCRTIAGMARPVGAGSVAAQRGE